MDDVDTAGARSPTQWARKRERIQHRLDAIVHEHRFTIAVVFPIVGAALLIGSAI